mmetsp:Transcript_15655/g.23715  ORF Transcript_15655/g.23715 Transcript_15655/m.23715 type:complete len:213 (-) Transcript_15655:73-711(-)|eukprot:CAMPEP_0178922070 /NCGR_PEP_ID=MMETSP0786-20121207/15935_1 /TAXON_ID=186022 /ORGANISM="Thalassionema frauenfeldii, Strain CCMP 1798" /LENGTH=212 /DNA_ID=CAMNT_0020596365 /DNA_START=54 /DNA_END=692 /DNA_ORIENTATION=+
MKVNIMNRLRGILLIWIIAAVRPSLSLKKALNINRRAFFSSVVGSSAILSEVANADPLTFATSSSGLKWADAKVGNGPETKQGSSVTVDYVLSTTGARYGSKIYSTADKNAPYRWRLGDGSTIMGLENAVAGTSDIPPMRPGGIRRVVIPSKLAYVELGKSNSCKGAAGPIPPNPEAFEEFQRFKNIYCNPDRQYQPDVVMDIKLYGKRSLD